MAKLTDRVCATTKPNPSAEVLLGDGDGLSLRIRPGGTRAWIIDYLVRGVRRKITIGNYHPKGGNSQDWNALLDGGLQSLAQARLIAAEWKQLRRAGRDPGAEWQARLEAEQAQREVERAQREAEAAQHTVKEAADRFYRTNIEGKRSARHVKYRLDRLVASALGGKKIRDVTRKEVIDFIEDISKGQREGKTAKLLAGEILNTAKRLFRYAEAREWVGQSCIETLQRKDFDAAYKPRNVRLRIDELAEVWKALNDPTRCKADPVSVAAIKLLILTGQRETEVAGAESTEFDLDAAIWRLPAHRTKMGRAHLVHLAPQAVAVLKNLKPLTGKSPYVFQSPLRPKKPIWGRSLNNALATLLEKLPNVTPCHIHDLRRSLISGLPDLGFAAHIGHKIANHHLQGVFAIYNHAEYMEERKAALCAWAARIEAIATCSNVIQLKKHVA